MRAGGRAERLPLFWLHGMFNGDGLYTWNVIEELEPATADLGRSSRMATTASRSSADIRVLAARAPRVSFVSIRPHGPYRIGGFCNGALIAYEIAACSKLKEKL